MNTLQITPLLLLWVLLSCQTPSKTDVQLIDNFGSYWYQNKAEITSYDLQQSRYGENRSGEAVLIYVTEPFSDQEKVKVDHPDQEPYTNVLKLNVTKSFHTGIYPYTMMNSSFFPLDGRPHVLKITTGIQEWCGHTYTELVQNSRYSINHRSYFQGKSQDISLSKTWTEDDLWSLIRIQPEALPIGQHKVIPSFFYFRFHKDEIKAYDCEITKTQDRDLISYTIKYLNIGRTLTIQFKDSFPYEIESWEEHHLPSESKTIAKKKARQLLPYWELNRNVDGHYRDSLQLISQELPKNQSNP